MKYPDSLQFTLYAEIKQSYNKLPQNIYYSVGAPEVSATKKKQKKTSLLCGGGIDCQSDCV